MIAVGEALPPSVAMAYGLAGIALLAGLRELARRRHWGVGSACLLIGMLLAVATVVFTQSAAGLGQQLLAISIGGASALVVARRIRLAYAPRWIAGFHGLLGLAAMSVAVSLYRDPSSLGLADPAAQQIWGSARTGVALVLAFGAAGAAGAVIAMMDRARRPAPPAAQAVLPVVIAGLVVCFQTSPAAPLLFATAGLSSLAGSLILLAAERRVRLCILAILSGGAAASLGLVFDNPAMLIGGAAAMGTGAALIRLLHRSDATPLSKRGVLP